MNYMILDDLGTLARAIINFITDDLLKPFGYNHKSRIVYENKNYKILFFSLFFD